MKIQELSQEWQDKLAREREELIGKVVNTPYTIIVYNATATRYFEAHRQSVPTHWARFGGGSYWECRYGAVQFAHGKDPFGGIEYRICNGKTYGKSANGTIIPKMLDTKKEVIELIKSIGIFDMIEN